MPHDGVGRQLAFVGDGLRGFVTGILHQLAQVRSPGLSSAQGGPGSLTLAFGCALCRRGRVAPLRAWPDDPLCDRGFAGPDAVASYLRYWPFGFVRTNFYLIPLLMLLAGIGGVAPCGSRLPCFRRAGARTPVASPGPGRASWRGACVLSRHHHGRSGAGRDGRGRGVPPGPWSTSAEQYGADRDRGGLRAGPGSARVGGRGHRERDDRTRVDVLPGTSTPGVDRHGPAGPHEPCHLPGAPWLAGDHCVPRPAQSLQVFLYVPFGTTGGEFGRDMARSEAPRVHGGQCNGSA